VKNGKFFRLVCIFERSSPENILILYERTVFGVRGLTGNHPRQLDERGRFVLPAKLREKMSGTVHITLSLVDKCLVLYTQDEWDILEDQVRELPTTTNRAAKQFVEIVIGSADESEIDKQGRIGVDQELLKAVGITKDITLVGIGSKLEIWDSELYKKTKADISFEDVLEGISSFGLNI